MSYGRCDSTQAAQAPGGRCAAAGTGGLTEAKLHFVSWVVEAKKPNKNNVLEQLRNILQSSLQFPSLELSIGG